MKRIKSISLLHLLLVLVLGTVWGCSSDDVHTIPIIIEGDKGTVSVAINLPSAPHYSEPQTYASNGNDGSMLTEIVVNGKAIGADASIEQRDVTTRAGAPEITVPATTINETVVNKVVVLAFDSNGRVIAAPIYVTNGDITNNSFTIEVREDTHELIVLANINTTLANDLNAISAGQSKAFVLNKLQLAILSDFRLGTTNIPAWNATDIPMWGEEIINFSGDATITVDVELVRMMAKVDVNLPGTAAINFKLENVRLYNYNSVGQVTPNLLLPNWATTPSVPIQPVVAIPSEVPVALVYTATDPRSCTNKIYTFEANAGSANEEDLPTNTCIVIGGKYNGATVDSYYRIDFTNATSYLNLLRNHHYKVNVVAVTGPGHATPEDAFKAPFTDTEGTITYGGNNAGVPEGAALTASVGSITVTSTGKYTYISPKGVPSDTSVTLTYNRKTASTDGGEFNEVYEIITTVGELVYGFIHLDLNRYLVRGHIQHLGVAIPLFPEDISAGSTLTVPTNNATIKILSEGRYELVTKGVLGRNDAITINYRRTIGWINYTFPASPTITYLRGNQYILLSRR